MLRYFFRFLSAVRKSETLVDDGVGKILSFSASWRISRKFPEANHQIKHTLSTRRKATVFRFGRLVSISGGVRIDIQKTQITFSAFGGVEGVFLSGLVMCAFLWPKCSFPALIVSVCDKL